MSPWRIDFLLTWDTDTGQCASDGLLEQEMPNERGLKNTRLSSEYVLTYEDKDGDWMLVGDVPWEYVSLPELSHLRKWYMKGNRKLSLYSFIAPFFLLSSLWTAVLWDLPIKNRNWYISSHCSCRMFISSCKRLRIMRGSEATGLGKAAPTFPCFSFFPLFPPLTDSIAICWNHAKSHIWNGFFDYTCL